jgi:hypothetical protein
VVADHLEVLRPTGMANRTGCSQAGFGRWIAVIAPTLDRLQGSILVPMPIG